MQTYRCLSHNEYSLNSFKLVPIRNEDKLLIMKWRNEQMFHLRQAKKLTKEDQENYFNNVVNKLFEQDKPEQLLFSFIENNRCIGYGGLVHINWLDKNAEVSFLMNTENEATFESSHWTNFLKLIDQVAFLDLDFHKIFCYAYDVRPHLYKYLLQNNYILEARLKEHYLFENKYYDVVIHSKFKKQIS
jgi:RimJ/RimL family protein N-acetyltransferase